MVVAAGALALGALDAGSVGVSSIEGSRAELVAGSAAGGDASRTWARRGEVPSTSDGASRARAWGG